MSILDVHKFMDQSKGKKIPDKIILIDAQLRFVLEVNGSIEHITWFINVDRLTDFIEAYFNKTFR